MSIKALRLRISINDDIWAVRSTNKLWVRSNDQFMIALANPHKVRFILRTLALKDISGKHQKSFFTLRNEISFKGFSTDEKYFKMFDELWELTNG